MSGTTVKAFTTAATGLANVLKTSCNFCSAFDPDTHNGEAPQLVSFDAIWDTGATHSAISENIIKALGLQPVSMAQVHSVEGLQNAEVFKVNIGLPNGVQFKEVSVTKARLPPGADSLIGMDIIGTGDFAVTNKNGKTVFTFRWPSIERIDFVETMKNRNSALRLSLLPQRKNNPRVGVNAPCPCGSGRKFKKCCKNAR